MDRSTTRRALLRFAAAAPLAALPLIGGCAIFGAAANAMRGDVPAAYDGLKGQAVAVMVDVDDAALIDWPELRLDIASGVQDKLQQAQKAESKELEGTQFPYAPASVVRYQREHPETRTEPVGNVAPRLAGVTRLIFIEMQTFQTRSVSTVELYRGTAEARVKVVAVTDGQAKTVYEDTVRTVFPRSSPEEGVLNADDYAIYRGTVSDFTAEIAKTFITHPEEG